MLNTKKILLSGGGTIGSVSPLISIIEKLAKKDDNKYSFCWLGTKEGPEREVVEDLASKTQVQIKFISIISGKYRRYFSLHNILDLFKIVAAVFHSLWLIIKLKPDIFISAGSFISVPVAWACWLGRVPVLIHQQDARPGLANKLISPIASCITVTFKRSLEDYGPKAVLTGNIIRDEFVNFKISKADALNKIGLSINLPTVLVLGGGTGSVFINELVNSCLPELSKFCQIIHITGKNKQLMIANDQPNYRGFEFVFTDGMIKAYYAADLIVSRCGMGVLTEISYLGKPSILIPLADSHQLDNAKIFAEKNAAIVLSQEELDGNNFIEQIKKILPDKARLISLSENIKQVIKVDDNDGIIKIIEELII